MLRKVAVLTVAWCVLPAWLGAQTVEFTVKTASANIHKAPSTGSPVIGRAARGTLLEVTRELGDWVRVSWPQSEDGGGYVHVSFGTLSTGSAPRAGASLLSAQPTPAQVAPAIGTTREESLANPEPSSTNRAVYVAPPTHMFGVGGLMAGSTPAFGATTRLWSRSRFGVQVELSRSSSTAVDAATRMTALQFAPSVVYFLADAVTEAVWVRPYVGGGVSYTRSRLSIPTIEGSSSPAESEMGYRAHGGSEFTFPGVPKFAVSADLGYQPRTIPFPGYELGGLGFTIAAHWYVK